MTDRSGDAGGPMARRLSPFRRSAAFAAADRLHAGQWTKLGPSLLAWPVPLLLGVLWWYGCRHGWISAQVLPPPSQVGQVLVDDWSSGELQRNLTISLLRVAGGASLGVFVGLLLGVSMALSETVKDYLYPTFRVVAYIPLLGWLPLLVLFVGIGETLKILLIAKAAFVPVTLNTYRGIRDVPGHYLELGRVYRFSAWQSLWRIVVPAAFPQIWAGVRYALTQSWLLLVVVEFLASSEGLGYMMISGQQLFQLDQVAAAIGVVGVIGLLLDRALRAVETVMSKHRKR
ncbi:sulfonate transport system permease protein [Paraburkholderia sp. JPY465]|uniref:ABC transporter permease n=1 Tax=Paraburkholderia sp. JPY465 TaxID=3042285 RepID=UPI003D1C90F2